MPRSKSRTLRQLQAAMRTIPMSEFMRLTPSGRSAYGSLFDDLAVLLPASAAPEPRRPQVHESGVSVFPSTTPSRFPSEPPTRDGFRKLQPLQASQDPGPWTRALCLLGLGERDAFDALTAHRELWVKGDAFRTLKEVGFTFDETVPPLTDRAPNIGPELYLS